MRTALQLAVETGNRSEIQRRWFGSDHRLRANSDRHGKLAVEVKLDRVARNGRTLYRARRGETLDGSVAVDRKGNVYFPVERNGLHHLVCLGSAWKSLKERCPSGAHTIAQLPGKPQAIDVTDDGAKLALAFGPSIKTWNAKDGLQPLVTMPGTVKDMSYLPDGTLAARSVMPSAMEGFTFFTIQPGTTEAVPLGAPVPLTNYRERLRL